MRTTLFWALAAFAVVACDQDNATRGEASGDGALLAEPDTLWPNPSNIPVCWESEAAAPAADAGAKDVATEKEWVRLALASSWTAANPRIKFTGWGTCGAASKGIRIKVGSSFNGPHAKDLGKRIDGTKDGMLLVFDLEDQAKVAPMFRTFFGPCFASPATRRTCIESIAVHEFGHALGLRHEQDRSEVNEPCDRDQPYSTGRGVTTTAYDAASIMNYCKENRILAGTALSAADKKGILALYREASADGGAPDDNAGRPFATANASGLDVAIAGREAEVTITYPNVTTPSQLPDPARALTLVDGTKTIAVAAGPWTQTSDKKGLTTSAKWTPAAGAARQVAIRFDGRYVSQAYVDVAAVLVKDAVAKLGKPLGFTVEAVAGPGVAITGMRAQAFWLKSRDVLELTTTCAASPRGQACTVQSRAPLAGSGELRLDGWATVAGEEHRDDARVTAAP